MRLIDADALQAEGWILARAVPTQYGMTTQTKSLAYVEPAAVAPVWQGANPAGCEGPERLCGEALGGAVETDGRANGGVPAAPQRGDRKAVYGAAVRGANWVEGG